LALALIAAGPAPAAASATDTLTVFAASDLALAFTEIAPRFERVHGTAVRLVFGSTGNLVLQVRHGAPADVIFAANISFIDQLASDGLAAPGSRRLYARGRIVLATKSAALRALQLRDLVGPAIRRFAIANPEHAPYGMAAKQALESEGIWDRLQPKIVFAENIRQALQFLQAGAVDAAIVALSVAKDPEVRYTLIEEKSHQPLDQAVAVLKSSKRRALAGDFVAFVLGATGREIMTRYGFIVPK